MRTMPTVEPNGLECSDILHEDKVRAFCLFVGALQSAYRDSAYSTPTDACRGWDTCQQSNGTNNMCDSEVTHFLTAVHALDSNAVSMLQSLLEQQALQALLSSASPAAGRGPRSASARNWSCIWQPRVATSKGVRVPDNLQDTRSPGSDVAPLEALVSLLALHRLRILL